jgi:hypothetical protein
MREESLPRDLYHLNEKLFVHVALCMKLQEKVRRFSRAALDIEALKPQKILNQCQ